MTTKKESPTGQEVELQKETQATSKIGADDLTSKDTNSPLTTQIQFTEYLAGLAPEGETLLVVQQKPVVKNGQPVLHGDGSQKFVWIPQLPEKQMIHRLKAGQAWYANTGSFILDRMVERLSASKHNCTHVLCMVLDDIGTKSKKPPLEPTWIVETSPENYQYGYTFSEQPTKEDFTAAITAIAAAGYTDPGATNAVRNFRIPGSVNLKPGRENFASKLVAFDKQREFTLDEICTALSVVPGAADGDCAGYTPVRLKGHQSDPVLQWLDQNGLVLSQPNGDGWLDIVCPNHSEHSDGSFIARYHPADHGFFCFHGHCEALGTADFLDWVRENGGPDVNHGVRADLVSASLSDALSKTEPPEGLFTTPEPVDLPALLAEIERAVTDDPAALFTDKVIGMIKTLRHASKDGKEWAQLRGKLKSAGVIRATGVPLGQIDEMTNPVATGGDAKNGLVGQIVDAMLDGSALGYDEKRGAAYIRFPQENFHRYLQSHSIEEYISRFVYKRFGAAPTAGMTTQIISVLVGEAKFGRGVREPAFLRWAKQGGCYFIDLGTDDGAAVEVRPGGWKIVPNPPVNFIRSESMLPMPTPEPGGDFEKIWEFINIVEEGDRILLKTWMLDAIRVDTVKPLLEKFGIQGSAKTSSQKAVLAIIHPTTVPLRGAPRSERDLEAAYKNNAVLSFENMSFLSPQMQDVLCSGATGAGASSRTLYTNYDETSFAFKAPVILNGIVPVVTAPDLADRTISIELPEIKHFRSEAAMDTELSLVAGSIFGGLLDTFAAALAKLPGLTIPDTPRLIDFALLGEAHMQASGHAPGAFMAIYAAKRSEAFHRSLESSPVAEAVIEMATRVRGDVVFSGTYSSLLDTLGVYARTNDGWPKSPKGLSSALRRQVPGLKEAGIIIDFESGARSNSRGRIVAIHRTEAFVRSNPKTTFYAKSGAFGGASGSTIGAFGATSLKNRGEEA